MELSEDEDGQCCGRCPVLRAAQGSGAVPASLVGHTKRFLTQEFFREEPELGGFSSEGRARDSCVPQSPAGLQGESQALPSALGTSVKVKSLWLLLRSLLRQALGHETFPGP